MHVGAVAGAVRAQHRRQDRLVAEEGCNGAGQLAHLHGLIGGGQARGGGGRDLELAGAVLGEEGVRRDPGPAHGGQQRAAERPLPAERVQRVGRARPVLGAGIDQLLLEAGQQGQAELRLQRCQGTTEEPARAALPGHAVRAVEVAEQQADVRRARRGDERPRRRVRHQHQVARSAERRVVDRAESGEHEVAGGDADTAPHALRQLGRGDRLAAQQPREVGGADKGERLRRHGAIPYRRAAVPWNRACCSAGAYSAATSRKRVQRSA